MEHLCQQLPPAWTDLVDGLQNKNFIEHVDVKLACPMLANGRFGQLLKIPFEESKDARHELLRECQRQHELFHQYFPDKIDRIVWFHNVEENDDVFYDVCFLCTLKDCEYPYAFFDAREGSCGYTNCQVGKSCGEFYLGTLEDIINYAMDDHARRLYNEHLSKIK